MRSPNAAISLKGEVVVVLEETLLEEPPPPHPATNTNIATANALQQKLLTATKLFFSDMRRQRRSGRCATFFVNENHYNLRRIPTQRQNALLLISSLWR